MEKLIFSTFEQVVRVARAHVESWFPRPCPSCGRSFESLADFLRATKHIGQPISYDAELGDWQPEEPIGTVGMSCCPCGSTLSVTTDDMDRDTLWALLEFVRRDTAETGRTVSQLLADVRTEVDRRVLADAEGDP